MSPTCRTGKRSVSTGRAGGGRGCCPARAAICGCVRRSPYRPSLPGNCARSLCPVTGPAPAPVDPRGLASPPCPTTFPHRRACPLHHPHHPSPHHPSTHRRSPRRHRRRLSLRDTSPTRRRRHPSPPCDVSTGCRSPSSRSRSSPRPRPPPTTILTAGAAHDARNYLDGELSDDEFRDAIATVNAAQLIEVVAPHGDFVVTVIWMYRIATNVRAHQRETSWSPLFSIFGWVLPPFLFIIPFLVLRELWKASDPTDPNDTEGWRNSRQPLHLGVARAVRHRPVRPTNGLGRVAPRRWSVLGRPRFDGRQPRRIRPARSGRRRDHCRRRRRLDRPRAPTHRTPRPAHERALNGTLGHLPRASREGGRTANLDRATTSIAR